MVVSFPDVLPLKNFPVDIRFNAHRLLHNKRAIYERVTILLLHMLYSLEDNDDLIKFSTIGLGVKLRYWDR